MAPAENVTPSGANLSQEHETPDVVDKKIEIPIEVQRVLDRGFEGLNLEQIDAVLKGIQNQDIPMLPSTDGNVSVRKLRETIGTIASLIESTKKNEVIRDNVPIFLRRFLGTITMDYGLQSAVSEAAITAAVGTDALLEVTTALDSGRKKIS